MLESFSFLLSNSQSVGQHKRDQLKAKLHTSIESKCYAWKNPYEHEKCMFHTKFMNFLAPKFSKLTPFGVAQTHEKSDNESSGWIMQPERLSGARFNAITAASRAVLVAKSTDKDEGKFYYVITGWLEEKSRKRSFRAIWEIFHFSPLAAWKRFNLHQLLIAQHVRSSLPSI